MGTTRSNISTIEKNARRNLEKSRKTIEIAKALKAPLTFEIGEGLSLYDLPELIYSKADEEGTKINMDGPELLRKIRKNADGVLNDKQTTGKIRIGIRRNGKVNIGAVETGD